MLNPSGTRGSRAHANQMPAGGIMNQMSMMNMSGLGHGHIHHGGMLLATTTQADEQYNYSIPSE
jgi:hypothetical protein